MITLSGQTYHCSAGETFDSIALFIYGDEIYASELLTANPRYCRMPVFKGGEELSLPVVDVIPEEDEDDEEFFMPAVAPWKE